MIQTGYPCSFCGVNAWTSCRHREAERPAPVVPKADKAANTGGGRYRIINEHTGKGYNFKRKRA